MTILIEQEYPDTPEIVVLVDELTDILSAPYPPESVHGYSVQKLIDQNVAFFTIRVDGALAGSGGVQLIRNEGELAYGELKRMYVRDAFRGQGLAKKLIQTLEAYTRENDIQTLRLETGIYSVEAIGLYERSGFVEIGPFGPYQLDPNSRFYEKRLA